MIEDEIICFLESYKKLLIKIYNQRESNSLGSIDEAIVSINMGKLDFSEEFVFYILNQKINLSLLPQVYTHFRFISLEKNYNFIFFARNSNYNFTYAYEINGGKIVIFDDDNDLQFKIANNQNSFLNILNYLFENEILGREIGFNNIDNNKIKKKIIKDAGGIHFGKYYDLIIG